MLRPPFWSVAVETVGDDVTRVFVAVNGLDPLTPCHRPTWALSRWFYCSLQKNIRWAFGSYWYFSRGLLCVEIAFGIFKICTTIQYKSRPPLHSMPSCWGRRKSASWHRVEIIKARPIYPTESKPGCLSAYPFAVKEQTGLLCTIYISGNWSLWNILHFFKNTTRVLSHDLFYGLYNIILTEFWEH